MGELSDGMPIVFVQKRFTKEFEIYVVSTAELVLCWTKRERSWGNGLTVDVSRLLSAAIDGDNERWDGRPPALSPVTRQSPPQDLQADCCRSFPAVCIPSRITSRGRLCRSNSDAMESTVIAPFRARIPFVTYDASRPLAKVKFTFSKRLFIQTREK